MRSKFILTAMLGVALLFAAFTPAPAQPLAPAVQAADVLTAVSVLGGTEGITAASPLITPRTEHAPMSLKIKQGKAENPVQLAPKDAEALQALITRAEKNQAKQAALAESVAKGVDQVKAEDAALLAEFETLRGRLEKKNGLKTTYKVLGEKAGFSVTMGNKTFGLHEKFQDPFALKEQLTKDGSANLLTCFKITATPDQKSVQNNMSKAMLKVGAMQDVPAKVSIVAA